MKYRLTYDEMYPVYSFTEYGWGEEVDLPVELYEHFQNTALVFEKMQVSLQDYYDEASKKRRLEAAKQGIPAKGFS